MSATELIVLTILSAVLAIAVGKVLSITLDFIEEWFKNRRNGKL